MAENETLQINGIASRWTPIRERVSSGRSPSDCFGDIEREFYRGLKQAGRSMAARGVPLKGLLSTALDRPNDLEALVKQTGCQEHASLLLDVVRCQTFVSTEQLLVAWLSAVWDSVRDLLQLDLCPNAHDPRFDASVRGMVDRIARLMARNPSRIPNRHKRVNDRRLDDLDDTLGRSIL